MKLTSFLVACNLIGSSLSHILDSRGTSIACSCTTKTVTTTKTASSAPSASPTKLCLTDSAAGTLIHTFKSLLVNTQPFNVTLANQLLEDDFEVMSDSVDTLTEEPLGTSQFASSQIFIDKSLARIGLQPLVPSVTTLEIYHTCNVITWRFQLETRPLPVRGVAILLISPSLKHIYELFVEFNTGAWLYDDGSPEC